MNVMAGGFANIGQAIQGKEISRGVGEGLVPKPVGGSEQLNDLFGIPNASSGLAEDSFSAVIGTLSPTAAVKTAVAGASKALILAAVTGGKSSAEIRAAKEMLAAGKSPESTFFRTGIYEGPLDKQPRIVIDDSKSSIKSDKLSAVHTEGSKSNVTLKSKYDAQGFPTSYRLEDVLEHPELFAKMPEIKDLQVKYDPNISVDNAALYPATADAPALMALGPASSLKQLQKTILHETQHGIQDFEGFMRGGNTAAFLPPVWGGQWKVAQDHASTFKNATASKFGMAPETVQQMATNGKVPKDVAESAEFKQYMQYRDVQVRLYNQRKGAEDQYMRIAGEAEARSVELAFDMQPKLRSIGALRPTQNLLPTSIYDVKLEELIPNPAESPLKVKP